VKGNADGDTQKAIGMSGTLAQLERPVPAIPANLVNQRLYGSLISKS
jgi:hypothetical protein